MRRSIDLSPTGVSCGVFALMLAPSSVAAPLLTPEGAPWEAAARAVVEAAAPAWGTCGAEGRFGFDLRLRDDRSVSEVGDADGAAKPGDSCLADALAEIVLPPWTGATPGVRVRLVAEAGAVTVAELSTHPGRPPTLFSATAAPLEGRTERPGRSFAELIGALRQQGDAIGACIGGVDLGVYTMFEIVVAADGTMQGWLTTALNRDPLLARRGLPASVQRGAEIQACFSAAVARARMVPVEGEGVVRYVF